MGMNVACEICRGACCESVAIERFLPPVVTESDWWKVRTKPSPQGRTLECRCPKLQGGKCVIYDMRPVACQTFAVGSFACRAAVVTRRPEQATEIFKAMDV